MRSSSRRGGKIADGSICKYYCEYRWDKGTIPNYHNFELNNNTIKFLSFLLCFKLVIKCMIGNTLVNVIGNTRLIFILLLTLNKTAMLGLLSTYNTKYQPNFDVVVYFTEWLNPSPVIDLF